MTPSGSAASQYPSTAAGVSTGVRIIAPSRLHFGLLGFQHSAFPFGGAGVMLARPSTVVEITHNESLRFSGQATDRAAAVAKQWSRATGHPLHELHVHVAKLATQHVGLGSGTQLAMAIARALFYMRGEATTSAMQLATSVGRGRRSSVGSIGFCEGGFIFERGHTVDATNIASTYQRISVPTGWRFVLCQPMRLAKGVCGDAETAAFQRLPEVSPDVTRRLVTIAEHLMIPALENQDLSKFGEAVFEFGSMAGMCFAAEQGGSFAGPQLTELVEAIRGFGIAAVGQSSWGPTIFAVAADEAAASRLQNFLHAQFGPGELAIMVSAASEKGAVLTKI